jgi:hypothetical protein
MATLALGLDPIEQRLDLVEVKLTEVGFANTPQERSDLLLAALRTGVCQEEFVYLEDIACRQVCEFCRVALQVLLVLIVVLLKLFVCRFVGNQFKHRFYLLISAATLSELDQHNSIFLLSLVLGVESSHG